MIGPWYKPGYRPLIQICCCETNLIILTAFKTSTLMQIKIIITNDEKYFWCFYCFYSLKYWHKNVLWFVFQRHQNGNTQNPFTIQWFKLKASTSFIPSPLLHLDFLRNLQTLIKKTSITTSTRYFTNNMGVQYKMLKGSKLFYITYHNGVMNDKFNIFVSYTFWYEWWNWYN